MKEKIHVFLVPTIIAISIFVGAKIMAMDASFTTVILPTKKISELPSWVEKYQSQWVNYTIKKDKDGNKYAWNSRKTVLFRIVDEGGNIVLLITTKGQTRKLLSNSSDLGFGLLPVWNSEGTAFAVEKITMINVDDEAKGNIYVVRINEKGDPVVELVAKDVWGSPLSWSNKGDKLVFANCEEIYVYSLNNSKLIKIAGGYGSHSGFPSGSGYFSWSPDDNQIAFGYWAWPQQDVPEYYIINNVNSLFSNK